MLTQMAKYLETVYVSGWQSSSTASSTDEPSPDLADYPMVSRVQLRQLLVRIMLMNWLEHRPEQGEPAVYGSAVPRPETARRAHYHSQGEA